VCNYDPWEEESVLVTIDVPDGMKVTEETFERLTSAETEGRVELVNGRLEVHKDMPRRWHQHVIMLLLRYFNQLGLYALGDLGAKVADGTIRVPDVAVLASADQLDWDQMTLPASAYHTLVEVVSSESETRDQVTKAEEYAKSGLASYWIVDEVPLRPDDGIVARYANRDGAFQLQDTVLISQLLAELADGAA
jgi:Uma2 family endonuclease